MDEIIIHYLNGTARKEEAELLLKWLQEKEENMVYFSEMRDLWLTSDVTFSSKKEYEPAFRKFESHIIADLRKKKSTSSFLVNFSKIAAAVSLLIICSVGSYYLGKEKGVFLAEENKTIETTILNRVITGENNKSQVLLPDGTIVWLNANSTLIFPEKFENNKRLVTLEGEGYFDVTHNEQEPFIVKAGEMNIQVLGTQFIIKNYNDKPLAETILITGKVEVGFTENSDKIILHPDQKISYNKDADSYILESTDASLYSLWASNQLTITNQELGKIFRMLENWYGIEITTRGNIPLKARYSMTVRDESKEEILRLLSMITQVNYKIENEKVTIYK
ncbi:MAG: FecR family protein [Tannerellaceae bacterium]|nr:FecR family protein [Tannerellaceae bacterium]